METFLTVDIPSLIGGIVVRKHPGTNKIKTNVYLNPQIYQQIKDYCQNQEITYSSFAKEALETMIQNPELMNPTKQLETEKAWHVFLEDFKNVQVLRDEAIEERLTHLEHRIELIMQHFQIKEPVKDKSAERIFDD